MHRNVQVVHGRLAKYRRMFPKWMSAEYGALSARTIRSKSTGFRSKPSSRRSPSLFESAFGRRMFPRWCTSSQTSFSVDEHIWAGFCYVSPPIAQCVVPCFWGWLFGLHMLNMIVYSVWYVVHRHCIRRRRDSPGARREHRRYSSAIFNAVQIVSAILSHCGR